MVMPGKMNGLELARAVSARRGDIRVVLMTGYSDSAGAAASEGFPVLRKPFTLASLAEAFPATARA
jgi:CheY-like chemotaxis protein